VAASLRTTDRHLRRAFKAAFGVSPVAYAQTQRLLLAKRLLTDTALSATDVAFASGFGSVRRFNASFKDRYRLNPRALRERAVGNDAQMHGDGLTFSLAFRPPYDWEALLSFLGARIVDGVEQVDGGSYQRSVRIDRGGTSYAGWVSVAPAHKTPSLRVTLSSSLLPVVAPVLARVKHLMDLSADPHEIAVALGPIAESRPGLRVPGAFDGFEIAVRAVLGQQISVKAARTLACRFAAAFGTEIVTPFTGVSRTFPRARDVARVNAQRIVGIGVVAARARTIVAVAQAMESGALSLHPGADVETTLDALRAIPGIGEWTAQYVVMRAIGWPDAFPHGDLGLKKALGEQNPRRVLLAGEAWRPWRAYAAMHLWESL
jgi:AraC family transcriptional regulator of adaptative response / DNA-3-methyladenine glycosylase II